MIQLETFIELKFITLSFVSLIILLLNLDKQFPVEQFEAAASHSTVPSLPLLDGAWWMIMLMGNTLVLNEQLTRLARD